MYSRTRVDKELEGKGIGADILSSIVSAILPKAASALADYGTKKIVDKIEGK